MVDKCATIMVTRTMYLISFLGIVTTASSRSSTDHDCIRECKWPPEPMTCRYVFTVEWIESMSGACFDCPFNMTDCDRPGCIAINGIQRPIITINRQLPGPPIEVCEGDTVEVKVWNRLGDSEGTSIHWHGIHNRGTPYMDGTPMITQCPIAAQISFTYKFEASPAGTSWWHSHSNLQRQDGAYGAVIVKQAPDRDVNSDLYNYDLAEHVVFVQDWTHEPTITRHAALPIKSIFQDTLIINGKGVFQDFSKDGDIAYTPREVFHVKHGGRYRFRVISNSICHMIITLQSHDMTAIATDGGPVEPVEISRLGIASGERYDFVFTANQDVGNYWFRLYTDDLACPFAVTEEFAILRYEGAPEEDPLESFSGFIPEGLFLNPLLHFYDETSSDQLATWDLKTTAPVDERMFDEPDRRIYLSTSVNLVSKYNFYDPNDYQNPAVSEYVRDTRQINHVSFKTPPAPLLSQLNDVPEEEFCEVDERWEASVAGVDRCMNEYCSCIQTVKVEVGQLVEIVMTGIEDAFGIDHPNHIHGYSFRLVGGGKLPEGTTLQDLIRLDQQGNLTRNVHDAVIKDTPITPGRGYNIVRFVADNPGWWLLHCHFIFHVADGMAIAIQVGEPSEAPPIPDGFPRCGSWSPVSDDEGYDGGKDKERKYGAVGDKHSKKTRKNGAK